MTRDDEAPVPPGGTAVSYDDGFDVPEAPVVPFTPGVDEALVSAARRVLDAAAERMGREIHWLRVPVDSTERSGAGDDVLSGIASSVRRFRLGLVGPLAETRPAALAREDDLRRRLDITTAVTRCTGDTRSEGTDILLFREVSEDVTAGLEFEHETAAATAFRGFTRRETDADQLPDEPAGYSVSPMSRGATETLVETAVESAFSTDRNSLTIAHQGDLRPASDGAFRRWAREYLQSEYGDSVVDEAAFREAGGTFPEDELVRFERRTDELCREMLRDPTMFDVVLAPALGGAYVSAVAEGLVGHGSSAELGIGDGRLVAFAGPPQHGGSGTLGSSPVPLVLAGCLLFDRLDWADAASTVRSAVAAAYGDGALHWEPRVPASGDVSTDPATVADVLVECVENPESASDGRGVRSSKTERRAIKEAIAALYSIVFEDSLAADDVVLNQLVHDDEEADIYLPEVGLNFAYWRRWSVERQLEVLLHELAHVEEDEGELDHGDEFYERLTELTDIAADWDAELEAAFGEAIDFDLVRWFVVESVHEETIEPDRESVADRKAWLCEQFDLDEEER